MMAARVSILFFLQPDYHLPDRLTKPRIFCSKRFTYSSSPLLNNANPVGKNYKDDLKAFLNKES